MDENNNKKENNENGRDEIRLGLPEFNSRQTQTQAIITVVYLVLHIAVLPGLISNILALLNIKVSDTMFNFIYYSLGFIILLAVNFTFLRRDFDPVCDHPFYSVITIIGCYLCISVLNIFAAMILDAIFGGRENLNNLNNSAVMEYYNTETGITKAMAIFLAPVAEELLFRGGIFSNLRNSGYRIAAYAVSVFTFALYHVWQFAITDPGYWFYMLLYIPSGVMLALCYERTNSIICPIVLHMEVNAISLSALNLLG